MKKQLCIALILSSIMSSLIPNNIFANVTKNPIKLNNQNSGSQDNYKHIIINKLKFGNRDLYLDIGKGKNAFAFWKDVSPTQDFRLEYNPRKNAYKIRSIYDPSLILAWNKNPYQDIPNNVFFTHDGNLDEHFWILDGKGISDANVFYIKNYANNKYLRAKWGQGGFNLILTDYKDEFNNSYSKVTILTESKITK